MLLTYGEDLYTISGLLLLTYGVDSIYTISLGLLLLTYGKIQDINLIRSVVINIWGRFKYIQSH